MKKVVLIQKDHHAHWVGDGFPVRNVFSYHHLTAEMSPFLLMDYAGPRQFEPTSKRLGVGEHPHRGFETVTIVYDGEVEHRDSTGAGGVIQKGDVQWMTAGSGIVHEEFHGRDFAKSGGRFEIIQLWVNLPKKDKMTAPRYQGITRSMIPEFQFQNSKIRVIAGEFEGKKGPAKTWSPLQLWDIESEAGAETTLPITEGHTTALFALNGEVEFQDGQKIGEAHLALFERKGNLLHWKSKTKSRMLLLTGEPIDEPVVGYGPFVMNTQAEIQTAILDYQSGKMGHLPS